MNKKTILFQGDSITEWRRNKENPYDLGMGYPAIIKWKLNDREDINILNRGVSGDRASHLRARWQADCLDINPDILSLAVGVNEVLVYVYEGFYTPHNEFERDYRYCLESAIKQNPSLKIITVQPFIMETIHQMKELYEKLKPIIKITDRLAVEYKTNYVPLNDILQPLTKVYSPAAFAEDGIHPSAFGFSVMAESIYKELQKLI